MPSFQQRSKAVQRAEGWRKTFDSRHGGSAEFRWLTDNKAKNGRHKMENTFEVKLGNGLIVEVEMIRNAPNDWTLDSRCANHKMPPIVLNTTWGNLVVESYEILERWASLPPR